MARNQELVTGEGGEPRSGDLGIRVPVALVSCRRSLAETKPCDPGG